MVVRLRYTIILNSLALSSTKTIGKHINSTCPLPHPGFTPHPFLYDTRHGQNCRFCPGWFMSRLRYLHSLLRQSENISKLRKAHTCNLLAHVVLDTQQSNSRNLIQQLHWLPIKYRINLKIANITFQLIHLTCLLTSTVAFSRSCSFVQVIYANLITVRFVHNAFGVRSFIVASTWNFLPTALL